jgi:hypothetical protein
MPPKPPLDMTTTMSPVAVFADDGADDVVHSGDVSSVLLPRAKVVDKLFGGQAFRFRK